MHFNGRWFWEQETTERKATMGRNEMACQGHKTSQITLFSNSLRHPLTRDLTVDETFFNQSHNLFPLYLLPESLGLFFSPSASSVVNQLSKTRNSQIRNWKLTIDNRQLTIDNWQFLERKNNERKKVAGFNLKDIDAHWNALSKDQKSEIRNQQSETKSSNGSVTLFTFRFVFHNKF